MAGHLGRSVHSTCANWIAAVTSIRRPLTRFLNFCAALVDRPVIRNSRLRTIDVALIAWFTLLTSGMIVRPILAGLKEPIGVDAYVYTDALHSLIDGASPWRSGVSDVAFAAPPPSLIPYLPFLLLPHDLIGPSAIAIAAMSAIYALWRLRMPLWWLLFPPTALAIVAGSSALPMLALLVRGGVISDAAAIVIRLYAAVPVIAMGRWRGLAAGMGAIAVTAPFLSWPDYIANAGHVTQVLAQQSAGGHSAAAVPWLVPITVLFLAILGRRRAVWLLVPALWPYAQIHYASIAMPILAEAPVVALVLAFQVSPYGVVVALGGQVIADRLARMRGRQAID
jgi:hypothetical protein